jgi:hypothetical protein
MRGRTNWFDPIEILFLPALWIMWLVYKFLEWREGK